VSIHSGGDQGAMAGPKHVAAVSMMAVVVVVVVVMMAMVTESSAAGVCNPNALYPCMSAIEGAHPPAPSRQCCNVVKSVDKNCMCNQLKSASFPAQMVTNGLHLPNKCGRTDLRGFRCGRKSCFPPICPCSPSKDSQHADTIFCTLLPHKLNVPTG
jgi:hypothetical protein